MANPASSAPRNLESGNAGNPAESPSPTTQLPTVDLTALTSRDDFLLELGAALGGQASVHPVDSIDSAVGQLASTKRGQMLVIDARTTGDVRNDVQRATQQAPHAVVVVFADTDAEKQVASAVKGTSVFAVLTIPLEGPKTTAVLDAAITDAVSRSAAARGSVPERPGSHGTVTLEAFRPTASHNAATEPAESDEGGGSKWAIWAGLGLAAVALAAGGAWYFTHGKTASGPGAAAQATGTVASHAGAASENTPVLPQPAVDTSIVGGQVDDLLEKARRAMRDRRYTAPTGDNALVYYRSALASDPTSGEAKDGLRRVGALLVSRFNDAMSGSHYADAALALATLRLAQPSDSHLSAFQAQLSSAEITKALADGNADRAAALLRQAQLSGTVPAAQLATWHAELARLQQVDRAQSLATLVLDRIRADELTSPAGDSAEAYLSQLRAAAPGAQATRHAASALITALLGKARQDAIAGDTAGEARWVSAARASGASAADVADFERQLASAQAKAAHLKTDRLVSLLHDRLGSGALTSPSGDSAADYLQQLEGSRPTGSAQAAAAQARGELASKLIARARSEMRSGETDQANADLTAAANWGASAAAVAAARRVSAGSPAEAPAAKPDFAALAAQLQRTRYVAPEYPDRALSDRVSGSVTIEYVVDQKGYTKDVTVLESSPPGVFDGAAIESIRHWRYRPVKYNGQPVEVPVRTRIRFELPN
ncbi:MAG TPA: energy transducer TonB [Steroidobacteraceae bacterium]|nr:energy transducer TonB [Steroidobacteraceae bacterium]